MYYSTSFTQCLKIVYFYIFFAFIFAVFRIRMFIFRFTFGHLAGNKITDRFSDHVSLLLLSTSLFAISNHYEVTDEFWLLSRGG